VSHHDLQSRSQRGPSRVSAGGLFPGRVTIVAGHFGSGKTEITLNAAVRLAREGQAVSLVDLDVVKPYFRSRSARELLRLSGVELVAPMGEYYSSDLPILLPQIRQRLLDGSRKVFMDAGGDDTGARVIGSLTDVIPPAETEFLLVLNFRRPFTPDVESAVAMAREIEGTGRMRLTGLLSNTHLMGETTGEVVREGFRLAAETARRLGLPLLAVAVEEGRDLGLCAEEFPCPLLPLTRIVKPPFEADREQRTVGPLFVVG